MKKRKKTPAHARPPAENDGSPTGSAVRSAQSPSGGAQAAVYLIAGLAVVVGLAAWALWPKRNFTPMPVESAKVAAPKVKPAAFHMPDEKVTFATYAGSQTCQNCHAEQFAKWATSNHGLAERALRDDMDKVAFDPPQTFTHGTQTTEARLRDGHYEIVALGFNNKVEPYKVERVIGNDPLRQFLVHGVNGRLQAMEACWDPHKNEWFDVYGNEDRKPGEWGHWTGRGMVWNHMCASCHNTRVRKNYDPATDSYHTTMAEMTVGCETCHGPMKDHADWQKQYAGNKTGGMQDPTVHKLSRDQYVDACAVCHARRGEITGDFKPGDAFLDNYMLTIVDDSDVYFPDGQIREENYEFASFLSSRMYHAGVRCMDCHDMHSMKTLLPGNQLCMRCHTAGGFPNAPAIMPEMHTFHKADSTGSQCINCHMPQTVYMQRHWRHDHGFTIPDPLLTQKFGIPNACNRCHQDKDAVWSQQAAEKWWGPAKERLTRQRQRATTIAQARQGADAAREGLLQMLGGDEIPYWKASATQLLDRWMDDPRVQQAVRDQLHHESALVRGSAARTLESMVAQGRADVGGEVREALDDPVRSVRIAAAWSLRSSLDLQSPAGQDLMHMLRLNSDQPSGQMQLGQFWFARNETKQAIEHMLKAIEWDPNSPPFHHDLALIYSASGNTAQAIQKLKDAIRLSPNEAQFRYELGLAYSETGDMENTVAALREAVRVNPRFARAWYNLGLALNGQGKTDEALDALRHGEEANGTDPGIPYASATILAQLGRISEAKAAAERALTIRPDFTDAQRLRFMLERSPAKQP